MNQLIRQAGVIARRDFLAIVGTPTFLIFLLAPLFMLALGVISGTGVASLAANSDGKTRIVVIASAADRPGLVAADTVLRALYRADAPPRLEVVTATSDPAAQTRELFENGKGEVRAVMFGASSRPHIVYAPPSKRDARYLAELAERALQPADRSTPVIVATGKAPPPEGARQTSGFGAVFAIFFLTLLLAGQSVGMLAEEKSNKVIEILAAAVRLEAVFLGKLAGMFGVSLVFVGFWGAIGLIALQFLPDNPMLAGMRPAVGLPTFLLLCALYFTTAYMLLGAVFLGVGALASSMREIQMLSLPITIFQVAMFGLSSAAAASPGTAVARFAQIFPFSSPFAMAARAADDPALWPHLAALSWQGLWVALTIYIAARMFRIGVLKAGGGWRAVVGLAH